MSEQVKPLATLNGTSRLPRLPVPSKLKMPVSVKRSRSPEQVQPKKRTRLDQPSTNASLRKQTSTSSLQRNGTLLRSQTSKSSLRPQASCSTLPGNTASKSRTNPVGRPPTSKLSTTKPVQSKPAASTKSLTQRSVSTANLSVSKPAAGGAGGKQKRAAWDYKGRLQDMEERLEHQFSQSSNLKGQLQDYNERIASLEHQNNHLSGTVAQKEQLVSVTSEEVQILRRQLREEEDKSNDLKRRLQQEISDLAFLRDSLQRQKDRLDGELNTAMTEINGLKSTIAQMTSSQAAVNAELESSKIQLEKAAREGREKDEEIKRLKATIKGQEENIEEHKCKEREHETMRRKLHNTIQELKGNIRVFCRVRPLLGDECIGNDGEIQHMNFPDLDHKVLELEKNSDISMNESTLANSKRGNNKYEFNFDRVFSPESSQTDVFEEISQMVQSALDGYNVCIFAYGQTGSGKTYTMEGSPNPDCLGMIPRAVFQIFDSVKDLEGKGWQYELEASFLEIYNETIRDLLGNGRDDLKHDIKLSGNQSNDVIITNLTLIPVESEKQINTLLKTASHNRAVGETKCNEHSSRSHSVFRLKLTGKNINTGEHCLGTLNLVDLAGSERLKESGAEGQRLKETLSINKSLSNLGNVIMAIGNKDSHIPYRNSKLTYLLQNSLGGNSKTLMFVNVSPKEECFQETLNSLRFATKVNQCNIGTAQKKGK